MVSIRVWDWVIMVIFRWGHSDRGQFDIVPTITVERLEIVLSVFVIVLSGCYYIMI